jgi:colicin import membrane protein
MKQSLSIGKEPSFHKIVVASALLHMLFIILAVIPIKTKEREYKSYFVNLVGPVEIKPSTPPALKKSEKKESVKVKPRPRRRIKPKKGVSLEPTERERIYRKIERLRAISALEKLKRQREQGKSKETAEETISQAIEVIRKKRLEGLSTGTGIPSHITSKNSESYYALITKKIWSEWIYPDFDSPDLEVVISIKIDKEGRVVSQKIEKSSGNILFDRSASKAITKASPLPPPPVEMEIGVRFRL